MAILANLSRLLRYSALRNDKRHDLDALVDQPAEQHCRPIRVGIPVAAAAVWRTNHSTPTNDGGGIPPVQTIDTPGDLCDLSQVNSW